jgi:hypothetical protein
MYAFLQEFPNGSCPSANMLLGDAYVVHHAFLILGTSIGLRRGWFLVY